MQLKEKLDLLIDGIGEPADLIDEVRQSYKKIDTLSASEVYGIARFAYGVPHLFPETNLTEILDRALTCFPGSFELNFLKGCHQFDIGNYFQSSEILQELLHHPNFKGVGSIWRRAKIYELLMVGEMNNTSGDTFWHTKFLNYYFTLDEIDQTFPLEFFNTVKAKFDDRPPLGIVSIIYEKLNKIWGS